jgi:hypothetical protein
MPSSHRGEQELVSLSSVEGLHPRKPYLAGDDVTTRVYEDRGAPEAVTATPHIGDPRDGAEASDSDHPQTRSATKRSASCFLC